MNAANLQLLANIAVIVAALVSLFVSLKVRADVGALKTEIIDLLRRDYVMKEDLPRYDFKPAMAARKANA